MNIKNAMRPYSGRRFRHREKMLRKLQQRGAPPLRLARAERALDAAMIPF
jgi:hypothetical protein